MVGRVAHSKLLEELNFNSIGNCLLRRSVHRWQKFLSSGKMHYCIDTRKVNYYKVKRNGCSVISNFFNKMTQSFNKLIFKFGNRYPLIYQ